MTVEQSLQWLCTAWFLGNVGFGTLTAVLFEGSRSSKRFGMAVAAFALWPLFLAMMLCLGLLVSVVILFGTVALAPSALILALRGRPIVSVEKKK